MQLYEYSVGPSSVSLQLYESFLLIALPPNSPSMSKLASVQVQSLSESLALKEKLEEIIQKSNKINMINARQRSNLLSSWQHLIYM